MITAHRWLPLVVCFTSLAAVAAGQSPQPGKKEKPPEPKAPAKLKNPTLKDVEKSPELYLGSRLTLDGLLGKATKPAGAMVELTGFPDAKAAATRLRLLAVKSLADQVAPLADQQPVKFVGTVVAPESARANYGFEIEEIDVLDAESNVTATLKPVVVVLPKKDDVPPEPVVADKPKEKESALPKASAEEKKAGKVPTLLIVIAAALALFMVVSLVVGVRLIKHMKAQPKGGRKQSAPAKAAVVESDADDDES